MKLFKKSKIGFLACALLVFSMVVSPLQVDASQQPAGNAGSGKTSELHSTTNTDYVWLKSDYTKGYRVSIVYKTDISNKD